MSELTPEDIKRIAEALAPVLVAQVKQGHHEFWIDGEEHYQDHLQARKLFKVFDDDMIALLKDMAKMYRSGRGTFMKLFLAFFVLGLIATAFLGFWSPHKGP